MNHVPFRPGTIKICGLKEPEHAVTAVEAGADMIGFIFAPTRRYIPAAEARRAIEAAKRVANAGTQAVGVFVNARPDDINTIADEAGLDVVQLSGDEEPDDAVGITRPVIKALRPSSNATSDEVSRALERWMDILPAVRFLVDGFHPGHFGGTGVQADWHLAATLAAQRPMILAGGLNPGNVAAAISAVDPIGVDVSSGVEIDGRKDSDLIRTFIANAKAAFSLSSEQR